MFDRIVLDTEGGRRLVDWPRSRTSPSAGDADHHGASRPSCPPRATSRARRISTSARRMKRFSQRLRDRWDKCRAAAQDARSSGRRFVTRAASKMLEQRLGELPRGPQLVAQAGERDRPFGLDDRGDAGGDGGERVGVGVQVAADADGEARGPQRGQLGAGVAELGERRRLVARVAQALGEREGLGLSSCAGCAGAGGGAAAGSGSTSSPRARRASRATSSGRRPWRRARASSTVPPPSVSGGATDRTTTRSPAAASRGCSRRSCHSPSPSATRRPGTSRVPWWTWTRRPRRAPRSSSAQSRIRVGATGAPRLDERVAAADLAQRDAREVQRDALARLCAGHRRVVDLHRAHAHGAPRGLQDERVAHRHRARPQRPGDDRPGAVDRERAVDVQDRRPRVAVGVGPAGKRRGGAVQRRARRRRARRRCAPSRRRPRPSAGARAARGGRGRGIGAVGLRDRHDAARHAEAGEDRRVLARLRHDAVVGGDDHEEEVDPRRAATIVRRKRSWPGTSTTDSRRPDGSASGA